MDSFSWVISSFGFWFVNLFSSALFCKDLRGIHTSGRVLYNSSQAVSGVHLRGSRGSLKKLSELKGAR